MTAQQLAQEAVEAERRGDFAGAISAFKELIASGSDSPELRSNLGIAYYQLRDFHDALREFQAALAEDPHSVPANLFCGLSLMSLQEPKRALRFLENAHRAQPRDTVSLLALARAQVASNEISEAHASYEETTRIDPRSGDAWYGLGITSRVLAERETKKSTSSEVSQQSARVLVAQSERALAKAMELDPASVHAHMVLGESFRIAERYELAVREYQAATEQEPASGPAWAGLATAYSAAGDDQNALKAAARALELDARDADTNALVAGTYMRQGDYAKAEAYAVRALQIQPGLFSAQVVLAKIYLDRKEPRKALPELQSAVKDDTDGSTYYLLATTLKQLGRPAEAALAMQKFRELHSAGAQKAAIIR